MGNGSKTIKFMACFFIFTLIFLICVIFFFSLSSKFESSAHADDISLQDNKKYVVIIDAGHGGEDGGTIGINGVFEKNINLTLAKKLYDILNNMDIDCILTRNEDILLYDRNVDYEGRKKVLDMQARRNIVESYENSVFISIHQNSFSQSKYSGFQAYYSPNDPRSLQLVNLIEKSVKSTLQPNNKRASKMSNGNIYLLDHLSCPSVLLECGFLSNAEECRLLCQEHYQNDLCDAIVAGIIEFLE